MDKRKKIIKEIKESYKSTDNFVKLFRLKLFRMMQKMSIEDLEQIEEDADMDLYHSEEDYKSILKTTEGKPS